MHNLTKAFLFSFLSLFLLLSMTVMLTNKTKTEDLKAFNQIIKLPTISLSTSYLEPRLRSYDDQKTELYPTLKEINYMDFVYGK